MGVPKFYRWLSERYPLINQAIEDSTLLPEFDNLYLDMNGIIHNATHGNDGVSKALTEKDVVITMMAYIDMMVKITKPKKLLYMAIDGVAPRAKMNQQRSRRFRAARDLAQAKKEAAAHGEEMADEDVFDSNCITPGTEFMARISENLKYLIRKKLKEDPVWQRFKVIFSGHEVEGEGEHKIVQFVRERKLTPDYDPNIRHVMAGLDADLIMLSLATHEPHFTLLREQVDFMSFKQNRFGTKTKQVKTSNTKWQLLHIGLLREYLEIDMRPPTAPTVPLLSPTKGGHHAAPSAIQEAVSAAAPFAYDGERVIDDFVLLACLCGNDFMPHLPSLDIGEGAMDILLKTYRNSLHSWGGYLNEGGYIHFERLEKLLSVMGGMEAEIFQERAIEAEKFAKRAKKDAARARQEQLAGMGAEADAAVGAADEDVGEVVEGDITNAARAAAESEMLAAVARRLAKERKEAGHSNAVSGQGAGPHDAAGNSGDDGAEGDEQQQQEEEELDIEPFTLDADDFKGRYYLEKFGITYRRGSPADDRVLETVVKSYVEALQWVLLYYFRGVPSWGWFFPFHFAPMTSDLQGLTKFRIAFRLGKPFHPFQQLLGCLPAASAKFLPKPYRDLMVESWSPIIDSYPPVDEIKVDMNGKRNPWEGVTLIPFIKEQEMMAAIASHCPDSSLTDVELKRNSFGQEYMFWHDPNSNETVESSNASIFPAIHQAMSRMEVFTLARLPVLTDANKAAAIVASGGDLAKAEDRDAVLEVKAGMKGSASLFSARPRPGCVVPAPGFPTLHTLHFSPTLFPVAIDIFGMKSKKDSMVLALGGGRRPHHEDEEEEDEAMLSAAGGFAGGHGHGHDSSAAASSHGFLSPPAGSEPSPSASSSASGLPISQSHAPTRLPAHVPVFSTTYAPGTTVAAALGNGGIEGVGLDILSQWRSKNPGARVCARSLAGQMLGQTLYCEWPHLREGLVVAVSDSLEECRWNEAADPASRIVTRSLSPDDQIRWAQDSLALKQQLLAGGRGLRVAGVRIGSVDVLVTIRKLEGMRRDPVSGSLSRVFASPGSGGEIKTVPQLMTTEHVNPDPRFQEQGPQTIADRFPIGSNVMVLRGKARGSTGRVVGYCKAEGSGTDQLEVEADVLPPEPPFGSNIVRQILDAYYDQRRAAAELGISDRIFAKVTGSVIVKSGHGFKAATFDIGLNLKVHKTLFLPGFVRPLKHNDQPPAWASGRDASTAIAAGGPRYGGSGAWEYTAAAIALVAAYQREYPDVFGMLTYNPDSPVYDVKEVPGRSEAVVRIVTWLQQLDTYKRPLVPLTSQVAAPKAIEAIELTAQKWTAATLAKAKAAAAAAAQAAGAEFDPNSVTVSIPTRLSGIDTRDVYKQEVQAYAVGGVGEGEGTNLNALNVDGPSMVPALGDRVANLSYKQAPLGLRGVVTAVHFHSGYVEVVFDSEFIGGTTLGGQCSNGKGALVPWSALLCLSRTPDQLPAYTPPPAAAAGSGDGYQPMDAADRYDAMPRGKQGRVQQQHRQQQYQQDRSPQARPAAASSQPAAAASAPRQPGIAAGPQSGGGFGRRPAPAAGGDGDGGVTPATSDAHQQRHAQQAQPSAAAPGGQQRYDFPKIVSQLEYYFSDSNLKGDKFLQQKIRNDTSGQGWVQISDLCNFNRLKQLADADPTVIASAVAERSTQLMLSTDRKAVRRTRAWADAAGASSQRPAPTASAPSSATAAAPAAAVNTAGMAPTVAAFFQQAAATAAPVASQQQPQLQQQQQQQAPPAAVGAVGMKMTDYFKKLMQSGAAGAGTAPAPAATQAVEPAVAATAAPAVAPETGSATEAERAHFNQLMMRLQSSSLSAAPPAQAQAPMPPPYYGQPPFPQPGFPYPYPLQQQQQVGPYPFSPGAPYPMMMPPQQQYQQQQGYPMPYPMVMPGQGYGGGMPGMPYIQQQQQTPITPTQPAPAAVAAPAPATAAAPAAPEAPAAGSGGSLRPSQVFKAKAAQRKAEKLPQQ